jgi:hypothetical protein
MAGLFDPTSIAFDGKQVQDFNELIMEEVYQKPSLREFMTIYTGIKAKTQIGFMGRLGLVGAVSAGCAPDENTSQVDTSEKTWDPAFIEDRFVQCWKDLLPSFWAWGLQNGVKKADLTATDYADFLSEVLIDAMQEAVLRISWFSDKSAQNYNGSPVGVITNGVPIKYFNAIDGIWDQLFAIATATTARKNSNLSTKNAQATYADQAFNSTDTTNKVATNAIADVKYKADLRARNNPDFRIMVTQSVFDQYAKELRTQSLDASFIRIENGYSTLIFEGTPVIALDFWDRNIDSYFNNGTKWYLPHRILGTTKANLAIGAEEESDFSTFVMFFDQKERKNYTDIGFSIDAKVLRDYLVQMDY